MARRRLTPASPRPEGAAPAEPKPQGRGAPAMPPIAQVAGMAATEAALREVTSGFETARAEGRLVVEVPLGEIRADHLARDRVSIDDEEMQALVESLRLHGQRTPVELTPLPEGGYGLISGWRRLRAMGLLFDETGEARFASLRALIRPAGSAADAYVAMIEENEIRVGLSHYERARAVALTADLGVFGSEQEALRSLFASASRAKRSKIGSFLVLHRALGDLLRFPSAIPERLGLALVEHLRAAGAAGLRRALEAADPQAAEAEIAVLQKALRPAKPAPGPKSKSKPVETGRSEILPGVVLTVRRGPGDVSLTLSGPGVTDELHDGIHAAVLDFVRRRDGSPD